MAYIPTYQDPSAEMEVVFWRGIRAMFKDAVYVQHNSRTLDFLRTPTTTNAPSNPSATHLQSRVHPIPVFGGHSYYT
ncbi:hypothetical protein BGX24_001236 [Mortierella sp. AD032]|nr:hypothetical protein BGX24_001236 [Mortierella sp. AD032]